MPDILSYGEFIELYERNVDAVPSFQEGTANDTEIKEGTVVLFYNMLTQGIKIRPQDGYNVVIQNLIDYMRNNKRELSKTLTAETAKLLRSTYYTKKNNPPPKYFSYWLSSAMVIYKRFPKFKMYRNDDFYRMKLLGARLAGVTPDNWSRMDVVLIRNSGSILRNLNDEINKVIPNTKLSVLTIPVLKKVAQDQEIVNGINDLFISRSTEDDSNRNLVAISLKERRAQQGRGNEYVNILSAAKDKEGSPLITFSNSIKNVSDDRKFLISEIKKMQSSIIQAGNGKIQISIGGGDYKNIEIKILKVKYVAYRILERLCWMFDSGKFATATQNTKIHTDAVDSAFSGLIAWAMNLIFSPPYYKVTGTGTLFTRRGYQDEASMSPFWNGMKLLLPKNTIIFISDSPNAASLVLHYDIALVADDEQIEGEVEINIRTSGYDNVDVLLRKITLGRDY